MRARSWLSVSCLLLACIQHGAPKSGEHRLGAPSALPATPRPTPSVASRSRALPADRSLWATRNRGQRLSVTCYLRTGQRTKSGAWPRPGVAAANRWPLGTRLLVQGHGTVTVTDRIGHGSDLDLFMDSRAACIKFGRRRLTVTVLP